MPRYHVNPKTGRPNICRATTLCPFGGESAHHDTKDEARASYEASMGEATVPKSKGKGGVSARSKASPARPKSKAVQDRAKHAEQITAFNALLAKYRDRGLQDPIPPLLKTAFSNASSSSERDQILSEFAAYDAWQHESLESYRPVLAYYQERFHAESISNEGNYTSPNRGFLAHKELNGASEQTQLAWVRARIARMSTVASAYRFINNELAGKRSAYVLSRKDAKRIAEDPKFAQTLLGAVRARIAYENWGGKLYAAEQASFDRLQSAVNAGDAKAVREAYAKINQYKTIMYWRDDYAEYQETMRALGNGHPAYKTSSLSLASQAHAGLTTRAPAAEELYQHVEAQWAELSTDELRMNFSPRLQAGDKHFDAFVEARDHASELYSRGETIGYSKAVLSEFADRVDQMRDAWFSMPKDL